MRRPLIASIVAHGVLALAVLAVALLAGSGSRPDEPPPARGHEVEAEMVFVDPGGETSAKPPPAAPTSPVPTPSRQAQPLLPPQPPPPASEQAAPEQAAQPSAEAPPEVRLGDPADSGTTDLVRSEDLVISPDPTARNIPPRYPPEAARRGDRGVVDLLVEVAPDGTAAGVRVYGSSGFPALDRAAREAVARWRFRARYPGTSIIGAQTRVRVRFTLD